MSTDLEGGDEAAEGEGAPVEPEPGLGRAPRLGGEGGDVEVLEQLVLGGRARLARGNGAE